MSKKRMDIPLCKPPNAAFDEARCRALLSARRDGGIGTLGEKLVHRALKLYVEPREECHEIPFEGFVADIMNEQGITEIQTRGFSRLQNKLSAFLSKGPVTLVYPVITEKQIYWFDGETGEISPPKKSTKRGRASDVFSELAGIEDFIFHDRLTLRLMFITAEEYRLLDGRGAERKAGATKMDIIPTALTDERCFTCTDDLRALVPELPSPFTAKDFMKALRLRGIRASITLRFVLRLGLIKRVGKRANAYLYEKC